MKNLKRMMITVLASFILFVSSEAVSAHSFDDVPKDSYYEEAVQWALENDITYGTSESSFSPNATCTRGQVVAFLWRAYGKPEPLNTSNPFHDVKSNDYFYKAVLWAVENGITAGTTSTTFSPQSSCTQAQIITFLYNSNGSPDVSASAKYLGKYYQYSVAWAETKGMLGLNFDATANCPRRDIVTYMFVASKNNENPIFTFNDLATEVNRERIEETAKEENFSNFDNCLQHKSDVKITMDELNSLCEDHKRKNSISQKDAAADVDLYFRALKYGYGGYYYFGDEQFQAAKERILNALESRESISTKDFSALLRENMKFVRDGHFHIDGPSAIEDPSVRYEYYYGDRILSKDEQGYYFSEYGIKWYFKEIDNSYAEIGHYLTTDGRLCYNFIQYCPTTVAHKTDQAFFASEHGTKIIDICWTLSEALDAGTRSPDYKLLEENGIYYISIRNFDAEKYGQILSQYANDASKLKNAKLIIYDTRCNGGGSDKYCQDWIRNFSGQTPQCKGAFSRWHNYLWHKRGNGNDFGNEQLHVSKTQGRIINNDIPIIFLTDDMAGSSGESVYLYTKCLENCIVFGSNTSGCQLCGNVRDFTLPNSGLSIGFSQSLEFWNDDENVDGKGYKPDVWCNPSTSLDSVLKMLTRYDLADSNSVNELETKLVNTLANVTLNSNYGTFKVGESVARKYLQDAHLNLWVEINGVPTSNYSVRSDGDIGTLRILKNGSLQIDGQKYGRSSIIITIQGIDFEFEWVIGD